jgi:CDP-2,3-bis-(O-geranylgeranyl)-sn-glycerol synthase
LLLVCVASFAAWLAGRLLGPRCAAPLDFGVELPDGQPLFGGHKTWRGVFAGVLACALVARLLGFAAVTGLGFGAAALLGDALTSALKRRLSLRPGAEVPGLDQIPEAVLPLLLYAGPLGIGLAEIAAVTAVFTLLDLIATPLRSGT